MFEPHEIQLSTDQQQELSRLAADFCKPWPIVLKEALEEYRTRSSDGNGHSTRESFLEAASRKGLIGCLQGGPPDLSSNPAYMEGFGESHG